MADKLRKPLNAPPAYPPAYGTQPGTQTPLVNANRVIVTDPVSGSQITIIGAEITWSQNQTNYLQQFLAVENPLTTPLGIVFNQPLPGNAWAVAGNVALADTDVWYPPSGDTTGVKDWTQLTYLLGRGMTVWQTPGTYYLSAPLAYANADLRGAGDATIIQPGSSWAGARLLYLGSGAGVKDVQLYGGTNTRSSNPAANAVELQAGAQFWRVHNVLFNYVNGWCVYGAPVSGSHGSVLSPRGEHNGGGIAADNGTAANVAAEWSIESIDLQNCETNPILYCSDVTDILVGGAPMNGSVLAGAAVDVIDIVGTCQTIIINGLDVGGSSAGNGLAFIANATGSPTECEVGPGTVQNASVGVVVGGASARLAFDRVWAKHSQTDGWQLNNTGAGNVMHGCGGNTNNASAGTGYDVNDTSTGHWLNDGFRYISGGVTAGRNLAAGNHYTEANPPSSITTAGSAPGGW